ncbi:PKD domain-containing protein [Limibacter armeniacum]|uniref:PKD domain-containing protein n=1 Tax=Limibacter armeniacum TaxID=466084 RepID=UPI002FE4FFCD
MKNTFTLLLRTFFGLLCLMVMTGAFAKEDPFAVYKPLATPPINLSDTVLVCFPEGNQRNHDLILLDDDGNALGSQYSFEWEIISHVEGNLGFNNGKDIETKNNVKLKPDSKDEDYAETLIRVKVWENGCADTSTPSTCYNEKDITVIFFRMPKVTLTVDPVGPSFCIPINGEATVTISAEYDNDRAKITPEWVITTTGATAEADNDYQDQINQDLSSDFTLSLTVDNTHFAPGESMIEMTISDNGVCAAEDSEPLVLYFFKSFDLDLTVFDPQCIEQGGSIGEVYAGDAIATAGLSYNWVIDNSAISFSQDNTTGQLSVDQVTFPDSESQVTANAILTVTSDSCGAVSDTIPMVYNRIPEELTLAIPTACVDNGASYTVPDTDFKIDPINGFTYSVASSTPDVTASLDANGILTLSNINFTGSNSVISGDITLTISSATCGDVSQDISFTVSRGPELPSLPTSIELCALNGDDFANVISSWTGIDNFTYTWTNSFTGGTVAVDTLNNGVSLNDVTFTGANQEITGTLSLAVDGVGDCDTSVDIPVTISRIPDQFTFDSISVCVSENLSSPVVLLPSNTSDSGFTYTLDIVNIQNGTIGFSIVGDDNSGIELNSVDFYTNQTQIDAVVAIRVTGVGTNCPILEDSIPLTIHRLPEQLEITSLNLCAFNNTALLEAIEANADAIPNYEYIYNLTGITGADNIELDTVGFNSSGVNFTNIEFTAGASKIEATLELTVNNLNGGCSNSVTIPVTISRIPDQVNLTDIELCVTNGESGIVAVTADPVEIADFYYKWSLQGGTNIDLSFTSDSSGVFFDNITFPSGASVINDVLELEVQGLDAACQTTASIPVTLYRVPDQLGLTEIRLCAVDGQTDALEAVVANTDIITGYSYSYSLVDGSRFKYRTTGSDNSGVEFYDIDFDGTSNQITDSLKLVVSGMMGLCENEVTIPVTIDRIPVASTLGPIEFCALNNESGFDVVTPDGDAIDGFVYNWTYVATSGGTVKVTPYGNSDSGVQLDDVTFGTNESVIKGTLKLEITGVEASCGLSEINIPVTINRTPDALALNDTSFCAVDGATDIVVVQPSVETITGFDYDWTVGTPTGGTVSKDATFDESGVSFSTVTFTGASNKITVPLYLKVNGTAGCNDSTSIDVTIHRLPDLSSYAAVEICEFDSTYNLNIFGEQPYVTGFNYDWSFTTGPDNGTIQLSASGNNNSQLDFASIIFDGGKSTITGELTLKVENVDATCEAQETKIPVTIYRRPNQLKVNALNIVLCSETENDVDNVVPANLPTIDDYEYEWEIVTADLNGGTFDILEFGNDSSGVHFRDIVFDTDKDQITGSLRLTVNGLSPICGDTTSILIPVNIQLEASPFNMPTGPYCVVDGHPLLEVNPDTVVQAGITYTWTITDPSGAPLSDALSGGTLTAEQFGATGFGLRFKDINFADNSEQISVKLNLEQVTDCDVLNQDIVLVINRKPDLSDLLADPLCLATGGSAQAVTANTETIGDFDYSWEVITAADSLTGGSFEVEPTGNMNSGLIVKNVTFDTGSSKVNGYVRVTVNNGCEVVSKDVAIHIERIADEPNDPLEVCVIEGTSGELLIEELAEEVTDFDYQWTIDSIEPAGSSFTLVLGGNNNSEVSLDNIHFDGDSSQIRARLQVVVDGSCDATPFYKDVVINRIPDLTSIADVELCQMHGDGTSSAISAIVNNDVIDGYTYTWVLDSLQGGSFDIEQVATNVYGLNVRNITFDHESNQIRGWATVTLNGACEPLSASVMITVNRKPDLSYLSVDPLCAVDEAGEEIVAVTEHTEIIKDVAYTWNFISATDGSFKVKGFGAGNTGMIVYDVNFADSKSQILGKVEVTAAGTGACDPTTTTLDIIINRQADVSIIEVLEFCVVDGEASIEAIAESSELIENFNYNWNLVNINGGTLGLDTLGNNNSNVNFTNIDFGTNESQITADLVFTGTGACNVDTDTIAITINRAPDISYIASKTFCALDSATNIEVYSAYPETIPGWTYKWTLDAGSVNGGDFTVSASGADSSALNIDMVDFETGSNQVSGWVKVVLEGACEKDSTNFLITINRQAEAPNDALTLCVIEGADNQLLVEGLSENVAGFDYQWTIDSIEPSGSSFSMVLGGNNNSEVTVNDIHFDGDSSQIRARLKAVISGSCDATPFYKDVVINRLPDLSDIADVVLCEKDGTTSIVPAIVNNTKINGYTYSWALDGTSLAGGSFDIEQVSADVYGLNVKNITFTGTSNQVTGQAILTVNGACDTVDPIAVTITIDRAADLDGLTIDPLCALDEGGEELEVVATGVIDEIDGVTYTWTFVSATDGTFEVRGSNGDNTGTGLTVHNINFADGKSQINGQVRVTTSGSCADVDLLLDVTINRKPEAAEIETLNFCVVNGTALINAIEEATETVDGFSYSWSLNVLNGGSMGLKTSGNNNSQVDFENITFDTDSKLIEAELTLTVIGGCDADNHVINVTIDRAPDLDFIANQEFCAVDSAQTVMVYPENTETLDGWNYNWVLDGSSVTGGNLTISASGNNNSGLRVDLVDFAEGSNRVSGKITVTLEGACSPASRDFFIIINREADLSYLTDQALCQTDGDNNIMLVDVYDETITSFNYDWTVKGTISGGDFTLVPQGTDGSGLMLDSLSFTSGSSVINATLTATVSTPYCTVTKDIQVTIQRQPTFAEASELVLCAEQVGSLSAVAVDAALFSYQWEIVSIEGAQPAVETALTTLIEGTTTPVISNLVVANDAFADGFGLITVQARITAVNTAVGGCETPQEYTIVFTRIPEIIQESTDVEGCSETLTTLLPFGDENVEEDFGFTWKLVEGSVVGANTTGIDQIRNTVNAFTGQNLGVTVYEEDFIDINTEEITFEVELTVANKKKEDCQRDSSTGTYTMTFHRSPHVELPEFVGVCEADVITLSSSVPKVGYLDYSWEITDIEGGTIESISDLSQFEIQLGTPMFDAGSFEIRAKATLTAVNPKTPDSCPGIKTTEILFHRTPEAVFTMSSEVGCAMQETLFDASESGVPSGENIYEWDFDYDGTFVADLSTNSTDASHLYTGSGSYTVALRVITELGCTSELFIESFTIHPSPVAIFTMPSSLCIDEAFTTTNSSTPGIPNGTIAYRWILDYDNAPDQVASTDEIITHAYTQGGVYTVALEVTNELGCKDTAFHQVEVLDLADVTVTDTQFICGGSSTVLAVNGGVTYEWSTGAVTASITVSPAETTTYYVTTYNANGCPRQDSVLVNVIPEVTGESYMEACEGDMVELDANMDIEGITQTYLWEDGQTSDKIYVSEPGVYSYTTEVTDIESGTTCTYDHEITLVMNPLPAEALDDQKTFCFEDGAQIPLEAAEGENYIYYWEDTGETTRTVVRGEEGSYTVLVTDLSHETSCTTEETIVVREACPPKIFAPNAFTPNGDGMNDTFFIESKFLLNIEMKIYNRWGEIIFYREYADGEELRNPDNGWDGTYRGKPVELGTYLVTLKYENELFQGKTFKDERSVTVIR